MPKPPNSIRLVPAAPDVHAMAKLARDEGWEETDKSYGEMMQWAAADSDAKVSWLDDPTTGVEFIVIQGEDREQAAAKIAQTIDVLEPKDYKAHVESDGGLQWLSTALQGVALAASYEPDQAATDLIERYLKDDEPVARRIALAAAEITGWDTFIEAIEPLREDPNAKVRKDAEATLEVLRGAA
jgi:hypothetical protein